MANLQKQPTFSAKNLCLVAMFTALICVLAPISLPIYTVPISLATLVIYVTGATLNLRNSILAVTVYILIGLTGLPVFSNFTGGVGVILGVTGGFIIGYIPCVIIISLIVNKLNKVKYSYPLAMAVGTVILYFFGVVYYMIAFKVNLTVALSTCVLPFIIIDVVKIAVASLISIILSKRLKF